MLEPKLELRKEIHQKICMGMKSLLLALTFDNILVVTLEAYKATEIICDKY